MKVLAISSYGVLGGAELSLAAFLEHRPDRVSVEALLLSDGPLSERLRSLRVPVRVAPGLDGRPRPRPSLRFARGLTRHLRSTRPDVVWAVGQKAALLALPSSRLAGIPLVWHKVDFSWDRMLALPLAAGSSGVVAASKALAEPLGPLRPRLVGVVWPPVRLAEDVRASPVEPTIGTLGRLVPYKGHHVILQAAGLLSEEFPDLRVVLAGAPVREYPDYPDRLRSLADELGLAGRLELPGHVEDVGSVLERLTVFVNATHRDEKGFGLEGLSGAVLEAAWAGVPVVAVAGGGAREQVVEGETGMLVREADPAELGRAIAGYLRDPDLVVRHGEAAKLFVRRAGVRPREAAERLFGYLEAVTERRGRRDGRASAR